MMGGRKRNSLWIGWAGTINQRGSESIRSRLVFYSPDERRNGDGDAGGQRADKTLHTFPGAVSRLGRTTAAELSH